MVGRRARHHPHTNPAMRAPPAAAERQRNRSDAEANQPDQQACGQSGRDKCDVGAIADADRLSDFWHQAV